MIFPVKHAAPRLILSPQCAIIRQGVIAVKKRKKRWQNLKKKCARIFDEQLHKTMALVICAAVILAAAVAVPLILMIRPWRNAQDFLHIAQTVAYAMGLITAAAAAAIAYRTQRMKEVDATNDRFKAAVTSLKTGNDAYVRIEGLYALERLANAAPNSVERQRAVDVLCGVLKSERKVGEFTDKKLFVVHQTCLQCISRLNKAYWETIRFDLSETNLSDIAFESISLQYACLDSACFEKAELELANLTDASVSYADFTHAHLWRANLTCASFCCANLTNANLQSANLTGANLEYADLTGAILIDVDLTDGWFMGFDLDDAIISKKTILRPSVWDKYEKTEMTTCDGWYRLLKKESTDAP
ncbi:MAG: pentapeptide repeat-containing protein [Oscillospiraceae bacterium]|jgi:uncharacterized protein YjbI with pentapeptide repeats|nr:pentapeptide repeat-containing protein [Oscillospiraceae bacterium]